MEKVSVGEKRARPVNRYYCERCPEESKKLASFALKGLKKPTLCAQHVQNKEEYENVTRKKCVVCGKTPSFCFPDSKKPTHCASCKLIGMINISKGSCKFESCVIRATFGFLGETPKYCKSHSEKGMIDLYTKKCTYPECLKYASYNKEIGLNPMYCLEHGRLFGCETDVKSKR
jgi:hypothetical protein